MPESVPAAVADRSWRRIPLVPRLIATAGGVGFISPASGTWGSLLASLLGLAWLVSVPTAWITPGLALGVVIATAAGVWASSRCTAITGIEDPSQVVIDEVAGVWATLLIIPPVVAVASPVTTSILGFLLFRLFDIVKPWPISALEHFPRGWGVMADDLGAGVLAGILAGALLH